MKRQQTLVALERERERERERVAFLIEAKNVSKASVICGICKYNKKSCI